MNLLLRHPLHFMQGAVLNSIGISLVGETTKCVQI